MATSRVPPTADRATVEALRRVLRSIADNARLVLDHQPGAERAVLKEIEFHARKALEATE